MNATSSGPFQADKSRLTSGIENPVIPVVVEKSVYSSRKGGKGRRVSSRREKSCSMSKKNYLKEKLRSWLNIFSKVQFLKTFKRVT